MLEFFEYDNNTGIVSIYDSHITFNKGLLRYFHDAYRIRLAVDRQNKEVYIYSISKDYALSGELNEATLLNISLSKTYARVCSRPVIDYLCKVFDLSINKREFKRFKAKYDEDKKVIIVDMKGEIE